MRYLALALLLMPGQAFAGAGFADAHHEHQQWIFPAYSYCLMFGLTFLFGMFGLSLIFRNKSQKITEAVSSYLIRHRILAIIASGVLLAIPLGIIASVLWEIIWFLSIFIMLALMVAFPLCLVNRRFREKWLLSPSGIKWTFLIPVSAIAASLLFIILTNCDILPGTDITYYVRQNQLNPESYFATHPYDSMKNIWENPVYFIAEIPIAIILYWFGLLIQHLRRKLSAFRNRKRETFPDIYTEE